MVDPKSITKPKIIFVDDEPQILSSLKRLMRKVEADLMFANSAKEALEMIEQTPVDVIVSDMKMPHMTGAELLSKVADLYPETIRIVLSGYNDMVMDAINNGKIWSYINKPWDDNQLVLCIEHAIFTQQIISERALLKRTLEQYQTRKNDKFEEFIGNSSSMQFVYSCIEKTAPSSASVFITGASGTGKEVTAKAIHNLSNRKDNAFLALNCAAIPSDLMESEIFGHTKGAFSGAVSNRDGAATIADGGTLFLDELSEMDILLQAKLLRFIQTGTFQKVGSSKTESVDIRFICATNRDPIKAIEEKKLREDLFYRLNVISIDLPLLVDRGEDILLIAKNFLQFYAKKEGKPTVGFTKEAENLMNSYGWPGNVRQLQNSIHSAVIMSSSVLIDKDEIAQALSLKADDISDLLTSKATDKDIVYKTKEPHIDSETTIDTIIPLADIEKNAIEQAIKLCNDNIVKAASHLEVSPSTLYRKIQSWKD